MIELLSLREADRIEDFDAKNWASLVFTKIVFCRGFVHFYTLPIAWTKSQTKQNIVIEVINFFGEKATNRNVERSVKHSLLNFTRFILQTSMILYVN